MIRSRHYGAPGPRVVVLHGGPGAPGYMVPVARELAGSFRVLEPLQRASGAVPLSVARHVADLHEFVESECRGARFAIVGHSWGAMLALAYGAAHPGDAIPLVLIGCGTFDPEARARLSAILDERMNEDLRRRVHRLPEETPDPDERLAVLGNLILPIYSSDLMTTDLGLGKCDARGYSETWEDMLRLQEAGVYPAAFSAIDSPVLMLHGAADPHPGRMIRASLDRHLPRLEYREWARCGHYPWLERAVREQFLTVLRDWLTLQFEGGPETVAVHDDS